MGDIIVYPRGALPSRATLREGAEVKDRTARKRDDDGKEGAILRMGLAMLSAETQYKSHSGTGLQMLCRDIDMLLPIVEVTFAWRFQHGSSGGMSRYSGVCEGMSTQHKMALRNVATGRVCLLVWRSRVALLLALQ